MIVEQLSVDLGGHRSYPIFIGDEIINEADCYSPYIFGQQVCIITNETVAPHYLQPLQMMLSANYKVDTLVLPDGERYKSLDTMATIYDCLLTNKHNRTTTLIALGGGVVGDMVGFAAATYQRGVNFIQVPTTLLSQVDSSVGGKTGVNHPLGKNMIGAFHQPQAVIIDTQVLATLPERELSAGVAEVIKYGLIADLEFYQWLEANISQLLTLQPKTTAQAIARSCRNKAMVVAKDEKESGIRAILNLGHTFGHAVEAAQGYGNWLHGEAVAAGMVAALELSMRMGWITSAEVEQLRLLLKAARLPVSLPADMSVEQFLDLMAVDKKVIDGRIRLVLLNKVGEAVVTDNIPVEKIAAAIEACQQ